MKVKRPFWVRVQGFVRLRPLLATFAILLIHVSSTDRTLDGTIDRVIQFALAYVAMYAALKPNDQSHASAAPADSVDSLVVAGSGDK